MKIIHETEVEEKAPPGRFLRWIVSADSGLDAQFCSSCVMRVQPGSTVSPAHSHPDGEELIYIISGEGKVYVDGVIKPIREGNAILFEKGSIHMVRNDGNEEMKVVCFYAPRTSIEEYKFHPEIDFDGGTLQ